MAHLPDFNRLTVRNLYEVISTITLHEAGLQTLTKENMIAYLEKELRDSNEEAKAFPDPNPVSIFDNLVMNERGIQDQINRWQQLDILVLMMEVTSRILPKPKSALLKKNMVAYLEEKLKKRYLDTGQTFH